MEERTAGDATDDPPLPLTLPPAVQHSETYVVQVPKDQIYRVPPPENARIVERYRNPSRGRKKSCCSCFCWIFVCLAILAAALAIILGISYLILSPKNPEFSILHVLNKGLQSSHNQKGRPEFEISVEARNPNQRMGIYYEGDGGASLSFKHQKIGAGNSPAFFQEDNNSTIIRLVLASSATALPPEIVKSMKDKTSTAPVSLDLTMNIPVRMKIGVMKTWAMDMTVACNFRVSTLGAGARVTSQSCLTTVKA